jgi:hypothetical protein
VIDQASGNRKKGEAILISGKVDFNLKLFTRDKKGYNK